MSKWVILGGSEVGDRTAGGCGFEHSEWYLYCLDIKAGMFCDGTCAARRKTIISGFTG